MKISTDFDLSTLLWYKIGGRTKYLLEVSSQSDFLEAINFIKEKNIDNVFITGSGSNLLFAKDYFDGAVIHVNPNHDISLVNDDVIEAFSGVVLDDVIKFAFSHSLTGLGWAGGLPGTIGAAVRGNVGAFGGEIKDLVEKVKVIDLITREIKTLTKQELNFAYRTSEVKLNKNLFIISVRLQLHAANKQELEQEKIVYEKNKELRIERHPLDYPNCGSVFKNITKAEEVEKVLKVFPDVYEKVQTSWHGKVAMGYLNKRLGFSGFTVGNAQVSEKHCNFIINKGDAKSSDVLNIIDSIQKKFKDTFGFVPEVEVEIIR